MCQRPLLMLSIVFLLCGCTRIQQPAKSSQPLFSITPACRLEVHDMQGKHMASAIPLTPNSILTCQHVLPAEYFSSVVMDGKVKSLTDLVVFPAQVDGIGFNASIVACGANHKPAEDWVVVRLAQLDQSGALPQLAWRFEPPQVGARVFLSGFPIAAGGVRFDAMGTVREIHSDGSFEIRPTETMRLRRNRAQDWVGLSGGAVFQINEADQPVLLGMVWGNISRGFLGLTISQRILAVPVDECIFAGSN